MRHTAPGQSRPVLTVIGVLLGVILAVACRENGARAGEDRDPQPDSSRAA